MIIFIGGKKCRLDLEEAVIKYKLDLTNASSGKIEISGILKKKAMFKQISKESKSQRVNKTDSLY